MMAKTFKAPGAVSGSRLTVRLPKKMISDIKSDMDENGYGRREQSRWISEAIDRLCNLDYYPELVAEDYIAEGRNQPVRISVPAKTNAAIERAVPKVRAEVKQHDVLSKIVRTAIIQRLIASSA